MLVVSGGAQTQDLIKVWDLNDDDESIVTQLLRI